MAGIMPYGLDDRDQEGQILLKVVASVLNELVLSNENENVNTNDLSNGKTRKSLTKFHGLRPPSISISAYLERISKYSGCSNECFVLSLIYIDRLITKKQIVLDSRNVHRLIITSTMLAAKFFDDHYLDNAHYGSVGGVPPPEMNILELEFLFLIEFNLHVTPEDYEMYKRALTNKARLNGSPVSVFDRISPSPSPSLSLNHELAQHQYPSNYTRQTQPRQQQYIQQQHHIHNQSQQQYYVESNNNPYQNYHSNYNNVQQQHVEPSQNRFSNTFQQNTRTNRHRSRNNNSTAPLAWA